MSVVLLVKLKHPIALTDLERITSRALRELLNLENEPVVSAAFDEADTSGEVNNKVLTGSSRRARSLRPSGVIRAITMRRSLVSRQREIRSRFSSRSRRRVISGSRVIMRLAISPQGSPSGVPRRIRKTLYCVADRSSVFSTWAGPRDSRSQVRARSKNAVSSGQAARRCCLD